MPFLDDGTQRCKLSPSTYTLGGTAADAVPIPGLERLPPVARLEVPTDGPATIQRLSASIVVRLDRNPLGIAPKPLADDAEIEFPGCRLRFSTRHVNVEARQDYDAEGTLLRPIVSPYNDASSSDAENETEPTPGARIVNLRTGEAVLLADERVVVGRDSACDLVVPQMRVSRRHFSVAPVNGGHLLRDESANGTIVNGSRIVGTYLLGHGDVVRLDEEDLRYEIDGLAVAQSTEASPTVRLDVSNLREEFARDAGAGAARPPMPAATLEIRRGRYAGASFEINRPVCSIGRGPQNDVRIRDDSVSTAHATLLRKGTSWFVVDLRSANGTFVDGSRVAGERELVPGGRLTLGAVQLEFRVGDGAPVEVPERRRSPSWLARVWRAAKERSGEGRRR
jgi:pSer/pThr/pTyr-binding forkhead associated (FHA) protein